MAATTSSTPWFCEGMFRLLAHCRPQVCRLGNVHQCPLRIKTLAAAFGFGQGCCINMYLGMAGYFGRQFDSDAFFIWMCACIYLPPLLVFLVAQHLDPYFDSRFGLRAVFQFRLAASLSMCALLIIGVGLVASLEAEVLILCVGAVLGALTGSVASASCQFFGVVATGLMPIFFLGQTASGAYVNLLALVTSFQPTAARLNVLEYSAGGAIVAMIPPIVFIASHWRGQLDNCYDQHFRSRSLVENSLEDSVDTSPARRLREIPSPKQRRRLVCVGFGSQVLAVALNMSLMPLANVMAHDTFWLGQQIVLFKLLGDFGGRTFFFLMPTPKRLRLHAALLAVTVLVRLPIWALFLAHCLSTRPVLSNALLLSLWVPFVMSGAFSGSWAQVVAMNAVDDVEKRAVARAMNVAVYVGFLTGIAFASFLYLLGLTPPMEAHIAA